MHTAPSTSFDAISRQFSPVLAISQLYTVQCTGPVVLLGVRACRKLIAAYNPMLRDAVRGRCHGSKASASMLRDRALPTAPSPRDNHRDLLGGAAVTALNPVAEKLVGYPQLGAFYGRGGVDAS